MLIDILLEAMAGLSTKGTAWIVQTPELIKNTPSWQYHKTES